jgi:lactate permease
MTLTQAFFPYTCLVVLALVILLIGPLKDWLASFEVGFSFPRTETGYGVVNEASSPFSPLRLLTHAGSFLLASGLAGYAYYRNKAFISRGGLGRVIRRTAQKSLPATIGVVALVMMSGVMSGTGQIFVLAKGTADLTASVYPVLSPGIGILGSFITSSNLASNILFGGFQETTADLLGFDHASILAAQTAGGAMGNTISPGNVLLGTTTAGVLGSEGTVIRMILPITLSVALAAGIIVLLANTL